MKHILLAMGIAMTAISGAWAGDPKPFRGANRFKDKPFQILAIDMAEDPAAITAFMKRLKIDASFPILLDEEGTVAEAWRISAAPTSFIIDTLGTLRYVHYGAIEWDSGEVIHTTTGLLLQ